MEFDSTSVSPEVLIATCNAIKEGNIKDKLKELSTLRSSLTMKSVLPIETVISTGIIPYIVEGVKSNAAKIQLECVWILNNLATGNEEQTRTVMYSGVAPILLQQLQTSNDKVYIPMVIGCLGNFCDEEKCRNILLSSRVIEIVLTIFSKYYLHQDIMENCLFLFQNAFSKLACNSASRLRELKTLITLMTRILDSKQVDMHTGILNYIMQICLSVMENNNTDIGTLTLPVVIKALSIMNNAVEASLQGNFDATANYPTKSILECLGNMFSEDDSYAQKLISIGLLSFLLNIYNDPNNDDHLARLEILFCWMNIAAGSQSQALFNTGILQQIVDNITTLDKNCTAIQFEAARRSMVILCNFICECNDETRLFLLEHNVKLLLEGYVSMVNSLGKEDEDLSFVMSILERMKG